MKTENKHNILVWAVVFLAVLNLATLATVLFHANRSTNAVSVQPFSGRSADATTGNFSGQYFCHHLNLSDKQLNAFQSLNAGFRQQAREISEQLDAVREKMMLEMASDQYNTDRLDMLSDSIGRLHGDLKKLSYRYYLDMKNICNPQQQEKLNQLFRPLFINDTLKGYFGGRGHERMHDGMHHGRRFNN